MSHKLTFCDMDLATIMPALTSRGDVADAAVLVMVVMPLLRTDEYGQKVAKGSHLLVFAGAFCFFATPSARM